MSIDLIIASWLLVPGLLLLAGLKLYVPWFLARHRDPRLIGSPDELAARRAMKPAVDDSGLAVGRRSA